MDMHGVGTAGAAQILADVGNVAPLPRAAATSHRGPARRPSMPPAEPTSALVSRSADSIGDPLRDYLSSPGRKQIFPIFDLQVDSMENFAMAAKNRIDPKHRDCSSYW